MPEKVPRNVVFPQPYTPHHVKGWLAYLHDAVPCFYEADISDRVRHHDTETHGGHIDGTIRNDEAHISFNCYTRKEPRRTFEGCNFSIVTKNDQYRKRWPKKNLDLLRRIQKESRNYFKK
ncbi:hypothetical protein HY493_04570 [Candidatus Woesearchaeota archaeon]|nr:hypothetical protein [Candidatus Woesearchaeota archaeon]